MLKVFNESFSHFLSSLSNLNQHFKSSEDKIFILTFVVILKFEFKSFIMLLYLNLQLNLQMRGCNNKESIFNIFQDIIPIQPTKISVSKICRTFERHYDNKK